MRLQGAWRAVGSAPPPPRLAAAKAEPTDDAQAWMRGMHVRGDGPLAIWPAVRAPAWDCMQARAVVWLLRRAWPHVFTSESR